jgi:predicted O-methyltransferase YrrM
MNILIRKLKKSFFILKNFGITEVINKLLKYILNIFNNEGVKKYIENLKLIIEDNNSLKKLRNFDSKNLEDIYDFSINFENGLIAPIQVKEEFIELLNILRNYNPKNILEIGTYKGGSLFCFCKALDENATIISIDLPFWGMKKYIQYDNLILELFSNFKKGNQKLFFIRGNSNNLETVNKVKEILGANKLDFIFIDGDHSYEAVKKDFELYSQFIGKGGVIAFHDILLKDGTSVFWNEIKNNKQKYKYTDYKEIIKDKNQQGLGIGILYF